MEEAVVAKQQKVDWENSVLIHMKWWILNVLFQSTSQTVYLNTTYSLQWFDQLPSWGS